MIFLFLGTCCLYSSFDHVLEGLRAYFYTVAVSYDGFDPDEKTEFYVMEDRRCEMQHEELFYCHSAEWVEEVRKAVEAFR